MSNRSAAKKWRGMWRGKTYNYRSLAAARGIKENSALLAIIKYLNNKITRESLFSNMQAGGLGDSEINLEKPFRGRSKWKCSEIMAVSGCDMELIVNRMSKVRTGKMPIPTLFAPKFGCGCATRTEKEDKGSRLPQNVLKMSPYAVAKQEEYFPLRQTPAYQGIE